MMGNKKLSAIRRELKAAIKANGEDPIQWLETRTAAATRQGGATDVLQSLKRVLASRIKKTRRRPRVSAKR